MSGKAINVIHVVGGGSLNELSCQLTADRVGRSLPVRSRRPPWAMCSSRRVRSEQLKVISHHLAPSSRTLIRPVGLCRGQPKDPDGQAPLPPIP
ncbi:MAG: FGGY-family carbohydrate kinase [Aeromicrobium sp.]